MKRVTKLRLCLILLGILVFVIPEAYAQNIATPLNNIEDALKTRANNLWFPLLSFGRKVFFLLVIIDFSWSMISIFIDGEKPSLGDFVAELLRQIMVIGLFWYILENGWTLSHQILSSIEKAGQMAGSGQLQMTPDQLVAKALSFFQRSMASVSWFSGDAITVFIAALAICLCIVYAAITILLVKIEMLIILASSGLIAGLSGTRWSRDYALSYLKYAVSVGIKLMLMNLIALEALNIVSNLLAQNAADFFITMLCIGVSFGGAILIKTVPDLMTSILQGVSLGNQGSAIARGGQQTASAAGGGIAKTAAAAGGAIGVGMAIANAAKYGSESSKQSQGNNNGGSSSLKGISGKAFKAGAKALASETGKQVLNNVTKSAESKHGSTSSRVSDGLKAKTEALKTQNMGKPYTSPAPDLTKPNAPKPDNPDK